MAKRPEGTPEEELEAFAARFLASDAAGEGAVALRMGGDWRAFVEKQFLADRGGSLSNAQLAGLQEGALGLIESAPLAGFKFDVTEPAPGRYQEVFRDTSTGRFISAASAGSRLFTSFSGSKR